MAKKIAPNVGIGYGWERGEDFWGGPMNENLTAIDALLQLTLRSVSFSTPPDDAVEGDTFAVFEGATGPWAGHDGEVAFLVEGAWQFLTPKYGWRGVLRPTNEFLWFDGEKWILEKDGVDPNNPGEPPIAVAQFYDVAVTISDDMYPSEPLVHLPILDTLYLPAGMADSRLDAIEAPSSKAVFTVEKNGREVASFNVDEGQFSATFTTVGNTAVRFVKGDRLTIRAPTDSIRGFKYLGFVIRLRF